MKSISLWALCLVSTVAIAGLPQEWMQTSSPNNLMVDVKIDNCPGDTDRYESAAMKTLAEIGVGPLDDVSGGDLYLVVDLFCNQVPGTDSHVYSANAYFAKGVEGFVMYFDQKYAYLGVGTFRDLRNAVGTVSLQAANDYEKANAFNR